jgi:ABC-type Fe3+ transport system permease subunit
MPVVVHYVWLLAVRRQAMGGGFRGENNDYDLSQMATVVVVLASISGVLFLLDRWIRRRIRQKTYESPT